jgi:hypothetical protein
LTAKEFLLLQYLLEHRGACLARPVADRCVGLRLHRWHRAPWTSRPTTARKVAVLIDALVTVKQFGYKLAAGAPAQS